MHAAVALSLFTLLLCIHNAIVDGFCLVGERHLRWGFHCGIRKCAEATSIPQTFFSRKSWEGIGLSGKLVEVTKSLKLEVPSKIQAIAHCGVATGKSCIIADQTGSGKTLAYLLPALQRMLDSKPCEKDTIKSNLSPFLVVLTPTAELAIQVASVLKTLANALKFRTACLTSVSDLDSERKKLRVGADVLVATPGRLLHLLKEKEVDLSGVKVMVLDEADVLLMDESFPLQPIGQACGTKQAQDNGEGGDSGVGTQFIFVTATLPDIVVSQIKAEFPEVLTLTGPGLHRVAPSVEEVLVDCSGPNAQRRSLTQVYDNKRSALLRALDASPAERTLVFCNSIEQCRRVENILHRDDRRGADRSVYSYHSAIDPATRAANLREFCRPLLSQPAVMISTDRASRGMDFQAAHVDHVILFDFPQEPSEYLRRVGRTGRAGRAGKVTILAYGKQLPAARAVMRAGSEGKRITPSDNL